MEGFGRQQCGIRGTERQEQRTGWNVSSGPSQTENCVNRYLNVQTHLKNINRLSRQIDF